MRTLFPEIKPYDQFFLATELPHELYVEQSGNPMGIPVVFLHGGPGAGCDQSQRRYFDPNIYRVVLFDQRGAGKSRPHARLKGNTTPGLIADIEQIRCQLGIDQWLVFGGSWGSTLGLAYAESFPERVLGLILRGIFLCRKKEIRWFYQSGASRLLNDYWQDFIEPIDEPDRGDLISAYYERLTSSDEIKRLTAARAWALWEARAARLRPDQRLIDHFISPHTALSLARIECHYFLNECFLAPNQLLRDSYRLAGLPGIIIHGRYDLICPLESALDLHRAWPNSELQIIANAGHAASEPLITAALLHATQTMAERLAH